MILLVKEELQRIWKETIMAGDTIWKFGWMYFSQDDQFIGRGLNLAPAMYETGVLFTQTRHYMINDSDNVFKHRSEKNQFINAMKCISVAGHGDP
jgi:hypothetical protein